MPCRWQRWRLLQLCRIDKELRRRLVAHSTNEPVVSSDVTSCALQIERELEQQGAQGVQALVSAQVAEMEVAAGPDQLCYPDLLLSTTDC